MTPGVRWLQVGTSGPVKECYLTGGRSMVSKGKEIWIVKLRDVNSLNDSELLKGQMLLVRSSDRLELEDEDDFLVQDLIGSTVFLQDEEDLPLGTVTDVYDGTGPGAHDLLCISVSAEYSSAKNLSFGSQPLLLPFAKEFVPIVDDEHDRIFISPPAGLLELALAPKAKEKKVAGSKKQKPSRGDTASRL